MCKGTAKNPAGGGEMLTRYVRTCVKIEQISQFHQYSKQKLHPGNSGKKLNRTS